jgi:outer membrane protein TolC
MRIERATSSEVAKAAGWWEDPELDVDLLRIVNPADKPYLGGASLAFTIPLSGVPRLERKSAQAYSEAAAAEIVAAEREIASEARMAAVKMLMMNRVAEELRRFGRDERIRQSFVRARRLAEAGELSTTELSAAERRRHEREHKLRRAENDADAAESELRRLLGVSPETRMNFAETLARECPHTQMPPERPALDYTRHPRVVAVLKRLAGDEAALQAEIRRQYPDLKLGPAYSREEGLDRFGLIAGIELPLWNRNRKGIAEAEGKRDATRSDAVAAWREVVERVAAARRYLERLLGHRAESTLKSAADADALADAGELDALAFIAVREEILDAEINELEWKASVCLAFEELEKHKIGE